MNDRFKFRCYNKFQENMFEVKSMSYIDGIVKRIEVQDEERTLIFDEWQNNIDNTILMQSTGLKDKNGKLIFELDYVRYANNKYKVEIDKFLGISLTNILNGDTIVMDDIVLFNCEVIGNEFESNTKI